MATVDIHIKGLAELQKFMEQLPAKLEANVMRGALRAGAQVIRAAAMTNVHKVSGALAMTIRVGARIDRKGGKVTAYVRAGDKQGIFYANMVEFGTKAHFISVQESEKPINIRQSIRQGRVIRASMTTVNRNVLKIGNKFVGPTVWHPGAKPHPFMRPALDSQASNAVNAAAEYIRRRLETKHGLDTSHIKLEGDE